jgi:ATP/maltotriose-dependent transcriptional regulator MalT
MGVATAPLVGRAEELALLEGALAELGRGEWKAVELEGEPGIGKTRLLAELDTRASRREQLVLSGSASELERELPFGVFVNALDDYVRGLDPRLLELLDLDVRAGLGTVFPSLTSLAGQDDAVQRERYRAHRAVRELLERLTATRPLVLILDDVHWADPASVDLLGSLLRRPPEAGVMIALGVRPEQLPARLRTELDRAHRTDNLSRVTLAAMTRAEAQELLGPSIDSATAATLYDESGGNPFYLEQLARGRGGGQSVVEVSLAGQEVPPAVAEALAEELACLSPLARLVLDGAAVVGDPFEPELAAAATAKDEALVLQAVDELLRRDLVRQTDVPRRFRFRHPLVRRAVYESSPGAWRLGAHERSSEALAVRGAPAIERAHHVERFARQGDATAVTTLREAGTAAAGRAPASAATWFGVALRLLPGDAPAAVRVELLLARARTLVATGQFAEGHAALLESLQLVPSDSVAMRVRLTTACAGIEHLLGRHEEAHERLVRAFDELADAGSAEAATLMIELSMDAFFEMDYGLMRSWAERARDTSAPLDDRPLAAAAAAVLTFATATDGASDEARALRSRATALVDALDDAELAVRLDAAMHLSGAELYLDQYREACAHAERALSVARVTGQSEFIPLADSILGQAKLLIGQLAEAGELLDNAVEGARLSGNIQALAGGLINRSMTALATGDLKTALTTAEENSELTEGLDQSLVCGAGVALASALLENGDPLRAANTLVASSGGDRLHLIPGVWRARALEVLTRCWLALGRHGDAADAASTAGTVAEALNLRMADAMAERAAAAVALDADEPAAAAHHALASALACDQIGAPVEAALSRTLAGQALAQDGQLERAVRELERAATELHTHGALRYRAAAERELRSLGQKVHRRTRPGRPATVGTESLTEREHQVARLVVDRKTNPEIAKELFLSPKTVETHIRNMFRKLEVDSRVGIARAIERADRQGLARRR